MQKELNQQVSNRCPDNMVLFNCRAELHIPGTFPQLLFPVITSVKSVNIGDI